MINLGGTWQAHVANDELRRVFTDPAFDAASWASMQVPGHWRSTEAFSENDAPLLLRTTFTAEQPPEGRRAWLRFAGVFYQGDVWLDGTYIGDTEGYFCPHEFEVTDALGAGINASGGAEPTEHTLAVEVTCAPQNDRKSKRNLTGVFQHWDCIHPDWNPGGIWQPVTIEQSGPVRISHFRAVCTEASTERAEVLLRVVVNATEQQTITLRTNIGGTLNEAEHRVAKGDNRIEWRVTVERPKLWWPYSLGTPTMTDLAVAVVVGDDEISDSRQLRIGLRQVRMKNYVFEINGERLHLKGANLGPTRMAIGEATPTELAHDLALAKEAGLNMIRLHAHISHPAIYEAADELGMCIWQDMPLQWGYARSVRKQAVRQAREAVDLLGHHASVITWCGHNEPLAIDLDPADLNGSPKRLAEMATKYFALQELPTWNKSVLDFGIHRALSTADPSRPVTAHSGILPGPLSGGTDSHLYFGWYHGGERDLPKFFGRFPRMARFVSEFGAQAIPTRADFCQPEEWPDLDWATLGRNHSLQKAFFDRYVPPAQYETFEQWQHATQVYQAELLRRAIEEMRRIKYKPNGGFALFSLADSLDHPAVTWSILGHDRAPKLAFEAVSEACQPVIVVADRLPEVVTVGDAFALDVHVVSDLRHALRGGITSARLHWPGGEHSWRWQGDVGADTCVRVGAVNLLVPSPAHPASKAHAQASLAATKTLSAPTIEVSPVDQALIGFNPDPVTEIFLDLTFEHPEATATNRYRARFV
jgi:beta-mannosidase